MNWLMIALRNLGRNRARTALASSMVTFAAALTVFLCGMEDGIEAGSVENGTNLFVGQLQVTKPGYDDNPRVTDTIAGLEDVLGTVAGDPGVVSVTPRVEAFGLVFGPEKSTGARMIGLAVSSETLTTTLRKTVSGGSFLDDRDPGGALLGPGLARLLDVNIGDSLIFITQASDGSIGVGNFVIRGLVNTGDQGIDSRTLLVTAAGAQDALSLSGAHRLVARTRGANAAEAIAKRLQARLPGLSVVSWETYLNLVKMIMDVDRAYVMIVLIVFLLLAVAGISNVMIVSVSERFREMGLIMSLGAHRRHVFFTILVESALIGFFGVLAGAGIGMLAIALTGVTGIDLSAWSEGVKLAGWPDMIYPRFGRFFIDGLVMTSVTAFLAAVLSGLFPAMGAARLEPARAMRQV
jgi:putative ABC transport system permease protein